MRRDDVATSQRQYRVRAEGGYDAFVPPPLPPPFTPDSSLVNALSDADRAVGELRGAAESLQDTTLLAQPLLRREAVLSSRIEGTQASLSDLVLVEAEGRETGAVEGDVREVLNYVRAASHVLDPSRRLPLSLPLLAEAHGILLSGTRGGVATPGEFRRSQNWIGPPGALLSDAAYVPPPPERLWETLDSLEKYWHAPRSLPPLVDIAAIHYQFEAIHPFVDGNGRVGRLLVVLLLVEWGLLPGPVLDLSAYIEPRRHRYYDALLAVSTDGDWHGWYLYMLEVFTHQARHAVERARRLHELRDAYRRRVATARASALLPRLVDELFRVPALTIRHAQDVAGVSHRAATVNVERLVDLRVLREVSARGRRRLFVAEEILAVVEGVGVPAGDQ